MIIVFFKANKIPMFFKRRKSDKPVPEQKFKSVRKIKF